ncbi:MAG: hypothetical protein R3F33_02495 [Planctomycetota bacterium]
MTHPIRNLAWLSASALACSGLLAHAQVPARGPQADQMSSLLTDWQEQFGNQWHIRNNRHTGTLEMLYGGRAAGPFVPNINRDADWLRLARYWVNQTMGMHGVRTADLVDGRVMFLPLGQSNTTDKMTVSLMQVIDGIPVEDGRVNALFNLQGELLSLHVTAAPEFTSRTTQVGLGAEEAANLAIAAFSRDEKAAVTDVHEAELGFSWVDDQEVRRWTLAWRVDVQSAEDGMDPVGFEYHIDARTGAVLKREASIHFFDVGGTIYTMASGNNQADHAGNPPQQIPAPYIRITSTAGTIFTDANGNFNYPGVNGSLNLNLEYLGTYTNANNDQGADYTVTFSGVSGTGNNLVMNSAPTEFVTAQSNAYTAVAHLRDWIKSRIPTDTTPDFQGPANCNLNSTCNAYYDGVSTNYYAKGGSCNNTAFEAVVAHEVGHWLNSRYGTGNGSDGMGEGNADVFALYLTDDPVMGRFFFTSGGAVRTGNNTRQYCGDGNPGCYGEVHADGEPWMGAAWNIREYLNTSLGNAAGDLASDLLFLTWMNAYNQTAIDSIIEIQWLTLDDNDGNINNGTPNYQSINSGFEDQGFPGYDLPFVLFSNLVEVDDTRDEVGPYEPAIDMVANFNGPITAANLHYKIGAQAWVTAPMTMGAGNAWTGSIPGAISPITVQYYFEGVDGLGNPNEFPAGGASEALSFRIGTVDTFLLADFEGASNAGWTGGVAGDTATTGIWERGDPNGTAAQPENDHTATGTQCWFTGQGAVGGALGANDVDGGATTLLSPVFNASNGGSISYWRWYSNSAGSAPNADIFTVELSGDGGSTWHLVENVGPTGGLTNGGWFQKNFQISSVTTPTANMRLRFIASDLGSGSIVEAAIDDVEGVLFTASDANLGTRYCSPANPNSSFFPATISAVGSNHVADNDVELIAVGLPSNEFGFFLNGTNQNVITNPGGSAGNLCVGGTIGRYNRLGEIFNSGAAGQGSLQLDLNDTPTTGAPIAVTAGMTLNFQCWYRDSAITSSNFSDAVSVTFQ